MTSFYDWYADLPVASPQVFGDQTDVPESGDWWNATYLLMWGSNVPVTRTPDAHWMAEARYKGQKVVVVSPDYADNTKFADTWLPAQPGTDGALAMAMGHVILKEFFVERRVPFFVDYVQRYTDLPFLVTLEERDGAYVPGKFLTAADLGDDGEGAAWKTVLVDGRTGEPVVPNGSLGFRYTESGAGRWNLDLGERRAAADPARRAPSPVEVLLPRFDALDGTGGVLRRGVPVRRVGGQAGHHGLRPDARPVRRARAPGCPATWPAGYDDADAAVHPRLAGADHLGARRAGACGSRGRWPRNAEESQGRTMIIMGAGICQWFHGDATYRAVLALLMLTGVDGPQRRRLGALRRARRSAVRSPAGRRMAMATDWQRPPRQMIGTAYWYTHTDQWRYDGYRADALASPLASGRLAGMHTIDTHRALGPAGLDAVLPAVRPQPARSRRRGAARRATATSAPTSPRRLRDGSAAVRRSTTRTRRRTGRAA